MQTFRPGAQWTALEHGCFRPQMHIVIRIDIAIKDGPRTIVVAIFLRRRDAVSLTGMICVGSAGAFQVKGKPWFV